MLDNFSNNEGTQQCGNIVITSEIKIQTTFPGCYNQNFHGSSMANAVGSEHCNKIVTT